jgi:hypothetical protein
MTYGGLSTLAIALIMTLLTIRWQRENGIRVADGAASAISVGIVSGVAVFCLGAIASLLIEAL